ncbi:hypothetical protein ACRRTK_015381 [Alexandromys fortis]
MQSRLVLPETNLDFSTLKSGLSYLGTAFCLNSIEDLSNTRKSFRRKSVVSCLPI